VELGVARLNYSALGVIDQLAAHEVQESARNVGGAGASVAPKAIHHRKMLGVS
jgi:hypothetical protein